MSNDTPPNKHYVHKDGESLMEYRIGVLETETAKIVQRMDKWFDRWEQKYRDDESNYKVAVANCAQHGAEAKEIRKDADEKIRVLHKRIDGIKDGKHNKLSLWTAIAALGSGLGAWLTSYFHK